MNNMYKGMHSPARFAWRLHVLAQHKRLFPRPRKHVLSIRNVTHFATRRQRCCQHFGSALRWRCGVARWMLTDSHTRTSLSRAVMMRRALRRERFFLNKHQQISAQLNTTNPTHEQVRIWTRGPSTCTVIEQSKQRIRGPNPLNSAHEVTAIITNEGAQPTTTHAHDNTYDATKENLQTTRNASPSPPKW